jgi:hypothetical protein
MNDVETITREELTNALENVNIHLERDSRDGGAKHVGKATYPDALACDLFNHVEKHREPEYEAGEVYRDAYGEVWMYSPYKCWYVFRSSFAYPFETPKRPLRKLAPEA